mmetsp:Transcript_1803/g.2596  ORF Transcript_1803/g.2596 Transcript_1803/m.2596 type:complete len:298 (+) Transcript_1803:32-925(+)
MGNLLTICCGDPRGERTKSSAFTDSNNSSLDPNLHNNILYPSEDGRTRKGPHGTSSPHDPSSSSVHLGMPGSGFPQSDADARLLQKNAAEEEERRRAMREEQARLERIVGAAGRDMVSLHGRGGGNGSNVGGMGVSPIGSHGGINYMAYYDAGYAAALAQELLQSGGGGGGLHALFMKMETEAQKSEEGNPTKALLRSVGGKLPNTCVGDGLEALQVLSQRIDLAALEMKQGTTRGTAAVVGGTASSGNVVGSGVDGIGGCLMDPFLEEITESYLSGVLNTKERLFQGVEPIVENLP